MWHCYIVGYSEFVISTALVIKTPYIPNICKAIMYVSAWQTPVLLY